SSKVSASAALPLSRSKGSSVAKASCGWWAISWTDASRRRSLGSSGSRARALENLDCPIRLLEPHQARGIGMQRIELGIDQRPGLFKVTGCGCTVPPLVLQHRQHGMTGRITGVVAQNPL